ncbi:MAG: hypothetical protein IPP74_13555 [Alphaproteobacteria bacterium]|nr:hypothetical protein [Alphaproteobacteria bacterium]
MFDGNTYEKENDYKRLLSQLDEIREIMIDGEWRTLSQLRELTGFPESSISAQLRNLRKQKMGSYTVNRKVVGDRKNGLYSYQIIKPTTIKFTENGQGEFV